jgi:hypothetical protein
MMPSSTPSDKRDCQVSAVSCRLEPRLDRARRGGGCHAEAAKHVYDELDDAPSSASEVRTLRPSAPPSKPVSRGAPEWFGSFPGEKNIELGQNQSRV